MADFYEEMAELAIELLGPGSDFGELFTLTRDGGGYDPATRKRAAGTPLSQTAWGTPDSDLARTTQAGSLTARFEEVLTLVPNPTGFVPKAGDRATGADGRGFVVEETGHVIKRGTAILWIMGCKSA